MRWCDDGARRCFALTAMTDLRGANAQATGSLKLGALTDMSLLWELTDLQK